MNIRKIPRTRSAIAMLVAGAFTMSAAESHPVGTDSAFVDRPAMRNWQADGERGLWIQTNSRWFYVRFPRTCHGLSSTNSLAFKTHASGRIDRTSVVVVPGGARCPVQSLAPSGAPPQARVEPAPQTQ